MIKSKSNTQLAMKRKKRLYILLALAGIVITSLVGCKGATGAKTALTANTGTVQRGNLQINISGSGNLAYSQTTDLAFEMPGTVDSVLVQAGDSVKEGQELAKLDTSAWQDQITALERQLTAAKRALTAAEEKVTSAGRQVSLAERQITTAQQQVDVKQRAMIQAQISLKNAQIALDKAQNTYTGPDIETAQANVDKAKAYLEYALDRRAESSGSATATWDRVVSTAQTSLNAAETVLNNLLTGADPDDIAIKKSQLEIAGGGVKDAQNAINSANTAVEDAKLAVEDAKTAVVDAQTARDDAQVKVGDAQKALDDAKNLSPVVKAPSAGFVTQVNVKGGDEIKKGTIAVQIADPSKYEADIMVSEMDIFKVKQGGDATIQADALSGLSFPAKVTFISPTATIQQGVVNYKVTVEVTSLQPIRPTLSGQSRSPSGTQAQSGQSQEQSGTQRTPSQSSGQPSATASFIELKQGLTVSVNILVENKTDVLLVPSRAITRQGRNATVQVIKDGGVTETRQIQTGISDYQNTEVTEGLSEGEKVVIPQTTAPTSTPRPGGGFMRIP